MSDIVVSTRLAALLGSIVVHAEEALTSTETSDLDVLAFKAALAEDEVQGFLAGLRSRALLPEKRLSEPPT